ncbi:MAG TPA: HEAT repeat domain-containing protein [Polyangiaceae bacterium]|jgi:HEAT repeat protein
MSTTAIAFWLTVVLSLSAIVPAAFVLVREVLRQIATRAAVKKLDAAKKLLEGAGEVNLDGTVEAMKKLDFPTRSRAVEGLLRDDDGARRMLAGKLFVRLGLGEGYAKTLRDARTWSERAHAADVLGRSGDPKAVPALVGSLRDPYEDANVRSAALDALAKLKDPEAIPLFVDQLRDVDERSARPIAEALVAFGDQAAPALMALIGDVAQPVGRVWAARILGQLKVPAAAEVLRGLLFARDDLLRMAAAEALGEIADRRTLQPLVQAALRDPAPQVRAHAAAAVAKIEPEGAVDVLIAALADPDYATRLRALEAFENIPLADTSTLERALRDPTPEVRRRAALALERVGHLAKVVERLAAGDPKVVDEAYEKLIEIGRAGLADSVASNVNHGHFQVRALAAKAAGELGAVRSLGAVIAGADDASWPVRAAVAEALGKLRGEKAVATLATMLADKEEAVSEAAAQALCAFPAGEIEARVEAFGAAYDRGTMPVRLAMVTLASRIDLPVTTALLARATADPSEGVRLSAVSGLGARGGDSSTEQLLARLTDVSLDVRMAAVAALGARASADAFEGLLRALPGAPPAVRDRIAAALADKGREHFLGHIDELVEAESVDVRLGAAWTLGRTGDPRGVPHLARFLRAPEATLRASAAGALGKLAGEGVLDALLFAVEDPDARTRAAVVNALGKQKPAVGGAADARAVEAVKSRLGDPDLFVRNRAIVALALLAGEEAERAANDPACRERLDRAACIVALGLSGTATGVARALDLGMDGEGLAEARRFVARDEPRIRTAFLAALRLPDEGPAAPEAGTAEIVAQYEKVLRGDLDLSNRRVAVEALARVRGSLGVNVLADTLGTDPAGEVRVRAAEALAKRTESRAREALTAAIADPSIDVAVAAVRGLSHSHDKSVQKALFARLGGASPRLNEVVEEALAEVHAGNFIPFLDRMMGLERPETICAGIRVLSRGSPPEALPLLLELVRAHDPQVRVATLAALARRPESAADEALEQALSDPNEGVRMAALRAVAGSTGQVMRLWRARQDPSVVVRTELAELLATQKGPGIQKIFDGLLEDSSSRVRAAALASLLYRGDAEGILRFAEAWPKAALDARLDLRAHPRAAEITTRLAAVLSASPDGRVRAGAVTGIGSLGAPGHAREILPALRDPEPAVRITAILALASVDDPAIRARIAELSSDPDTAVREAVRRATLRTVG